MSPGSSRKIEEFAAVEWKRKLNEDHGSICKSKEREWKLLKNGVITSASNDISTIKYYFIKAANERYANRDAGNSAL